MATEKETQEVESDGSPKYAGIPLKKALSFVEKIYDELGSGKYHSREDIAKVHDLKIPSTKIPLTAAQQYGLMELKHGEGLKVTQLFVRIHRPKDEQEKRESIMKSINNCALFSDLIKQYNGHRIPSPQGLSNILTREYHYKDSVAPKAVDAFMTSLKEYGLVDFNNNLILDKVPDGVDNPQSKTEVNKNGNSVQEPKDSEIIDPFANAIITFKLPLKNERDFSFSPPEDLDDEDRERIAKGLRYLKIIK